jgi:hypothetical protein
MTQYQSGPCPEASARQPRVVIPVTVSGKRFAFAFGDRMPALVDGSQAEVVVAPEAVADKYVLKLLQTEQIIELLDPGVSVLIAMRPEKISDELRSRAYGPDRHLSESGGHYIEVVLSCPLRLRLSGAKRAAFSGGSCTIPALDGRQAISLNQAFTFISEVFESDRQSHVGNAFLRGLFYDASEDTWTRLEDLRTAYEHRFRDYITDQCRVKSKKLRLAGPPSFPEWLAGSRCQTTLEF